MSFRLCDFTSPAAVMYLCLRNADQREDLPRKSDHKPACQRQEALASLAGVVALERLADLHYAPTQQDNTYCTNERKYKIGQIVNDSQRIVRGKGWGTKAKYT